MYIPDPFRVPEAEHDALLAGLGLGCLVSCDAAGFWASHLPLIYDPTARRLQGHLARANPHHTRAPNGGRALIVFQGPSAYVSPGWYASKARDPRVVPTWNYEAVHVHGRLSWHDDPADIRAGLAALSDRHEADRAEPWSLDDAPADYLDRLQRGVVGLVVTIEQVYAKRKLSQNQPRPIARVWRSV